MTTAVRWDEGEVTRLRRHLAAARVENPDNDCKAVATVAEEFGVPSAQVREVLARDDRQRHARQATYACDAPRNGGDIYAVERNALLERWDRALMGLPARRDPREGSGSTVPRMLTPAHDAAAEIAFARRRIMDEMGRLVPSADDPGPEITECLIYRRVVSEGRIVRLMVRTLRDMSSLLTRAPYSRVHEIAEAMLRAVTHGREERMPETWTAGTQKEIKQAEKVWKAGSALAVTLLWASASQTARRAAESRARDA